MCQGTGKKDRAQSQQKEGENKSEAIYINIYILIKKFGVLYRRLNDNGKETKSCFFENTNEIDKPLTRLTKKAQKKKNSEMKGMLQINHRNTKDHKDYNEQLYADKLNNLEEIDKLLETCYLLSLHQEEKENLNKPITGKEIESVTENFQ